MSNAPLLLAMVSEVRIQNATNSKSIYPIFLEVFEKATLLALKKTKTKKNSVCGLI